MWHKSNNPILKTIAKSPGASLCDGFILLDAVISIIVISIFILAAVGFYTAAVKKVNAQAEVVNNYIDAYNVFVDNREYIFNNE